MLKVNIDLVPYGRESDKETLHTIVIVNTGVQTESKTSYACSLDSGKRKYIMHDRSDGALVLVSKALEKLLK